MFDNLNSNSGGLFSKTSGTGLFDSFGTSNTNGNGEKKSLFGDFKFGSGLSSTGIFSSGSLFGNPDLIKNSSLFTKTNSNSLFKKDTDSENDEENEDDGEEEDITGKKEKDLVGFKLEETEENTDFQEIFLKSVENFYTYSKEDGKYTSKGKGLISLERHKEKPKIAAIVFRNPMGIKLLEGIFSPMIKEAETKSNGYRHIASFGILEVKEDKPSLRLCKISVSLYYKIYQNI